MKDRWDIKSISVHMNNNQKYQIWLNGCGVGEIVNRFDAVEKLRNIFDTIEALQQENEQLKAQAAVMREALKSIYYGPYQMHKGYVEILEEALATDAGKDYHNPADIEALKKAKYAIECLIKHYTGPAFSLLKYGKVIEAIDKAIGGDHNA